MLHLTTVWQFFMFSGRHEFCNQAANTATHTLYTSAYTLAIFNLPFGYNQGFSPEKR